MTSLQLLTTGVTPPLRGLGAINLVLWRVVGVLEMLGVDIQIALDKHSEITVTSALKAQEVVNVIQNSKTDIEADLNETSEHMNEEVNLSNNNQNTKKEVLKDSEAEVEDIYEESGIEEVNIVDISYEPNLNLEESEDDIEEIAEVFGNSRMMPKKLKCELTRSPTSHCGWKSKQMSKKEPNVKTLKVENRLEMANSFHICKFCGLNFVSSSLLGDHLVRGCLEKKCIEAGSKVRPFICQECGKGFTSKQILWRHQFTHNPNKVQCEVCKKLLSNPGSLKVHMDMVHIKVKYSCQEESCDETFGDRRRAVNHYNKMHLKLDMRRFKCVTCGSKFVTGVHLKKHMLRCE